MQVASNQLYHLFNQGNNRQPIFRCAQNYFLFLSLFRLYVLPHCDVLAWCLMPNHFHFMLNVNAKGAETKMLGNVVSSNFSNGVRLLQCRYTQSINKQENRSGSIFRQRSKLKHCESIMDNYRLVVFDYIHNNPLNAGIVKKTGDWTFSSYPDYFGKRKGNLINRQLASELIGIDFGFPGV